MENIYNFSNLNLNKTISGKNISLWIRVFDIEVKHIFLWKSRIKNIRNFIKDYFMISDEFILELNNKELDDKHSIFDYNYESNDIIYVKFNPENCIYLNDGKMIHKFVNFNFNKYLNVNMNDIKNLLKFNDYINNYFVRKDKVFSEEFEKIYPKRFRFFLINLSSFELNNLLLMLNDYKSNLEILVGNIMNYLLKNNFIEIKDNKITNSTKDNVINVRIKSPEIIPNNYLPNLTFSPIKQL